ncbi:MAG: hypothetical protein K0S45_473 [Nitrospira sp.]|nr:hypothetical protein [Nitrospira sp.]
MADDTKEIQIAGCQVQLTYHALADGRWTVQGIVRCGTGEKTGEQPVATGPCESREAAEREALERVGQVLGRNEDRSTSRVKNWS